MENSNNKVRVRFAPSPTGHLHVGGARSALYGYLLAKNTNGTFVLRVEDTDLERSTEESMRAMLSDLDWLGLNWDEGIDPKTLADLGPHAPYRQSKRAETYKEYAGKLVGEGAAYYCFLSDEEMDKLREQAQAEGLPQVKNPFRDKSLEEAQKRIADGESPVIRFKTPLENTEFKITDLVRGDVTFQSDMVGDFVLIRSNGMPVYNFCCVVDDALMEISHVLRAEEHLNNTLRQIMIYDALGFKWPVFGHMSIILGEDKKKLSKRHGATSVDQYRQDGFLPDAMNNYLALLGWSHPEEKEILSKQELISDFCLDRLNASPAVFDEKKLRWVNATHLRALSHTALWHQLEPFFEEAGLQLPEDSTWQDRALGLLKSSFETLAEAVEKFAPLSVAPLSIDESAAQALEWESTPKVVGKWRELVDAHGSDTISEEDFQGFQNQIKEACEVKGKHLFMPIRVAIIGRPHGAELNLLVPLLEKKVLLERADRVLQEISK